MVLLLAFSIYSERVNQCSRFNQLRDKLNLIVWGENLLNNCDWIQREDPQLSDIAMENNVYSASSTIGKYYSEPGKYAVKKGPPPRYLWLFQQALSTSDVKKSPSIEVVMIIER